MNFLYLIPARGGSKGIPRKNIKLLGDKPLLHYSIDLARQAAPSDAHICVSTDDAEIARCAEDYGLAVPFIRPPYLATDTASSYDVLLHALSHYDKQGKHFDGLILLQPTSPFRDPEQLRAAQQKFNLEIDMLVSVHETKANPYYVLFEENEHGYLKPSKKGHFTRRQDCPKVYEYNGALYLINTNSLRKHHSLAQFTKTVKHIIPAKYAIDLDTPLDWLYAEFLLQNLPPPFL
jgi:CMP-N,N'-diacetyllegionaminic acid synthase